MTTFMLKLAALASMLADHTGVALSGAYDTYWMRMIGRTAFPVYAFLIAEGCRHTRDIRKYMLRLGAFALVSEVPFDLFLYRRPFDPRGQNVFFTLLLGVAAIWLYELINDTFAKKFHVFRRGIFSPGIFACIPFMVIAYLIRTDYNAYGVAAIYACYVCGAVSPDQCGEAALKARLMQAAALTAVMAVLYSGTPLVMLAVLPAAVLVALYNGKKGYPLKMAFYVVYPVHLLVLTGVRQLLFF